MARLTCLLLLVGMTITVSAQRAAYAPDFASVQYAGSIGFISGGIGYDLSRRTAVSIHYGYVPKNRGGELHIVAAKLLVNTWSFRISERLQLDPLRVGAMVSYHLGSEFRSRWPSHRYPEGYYWWKTSLRAHLIAESSITLRLPASRFHSVTGYVDFNTNELYLISYLKNPHSLSLHDIIKVGYGVRLHF